jgi:hypothetical protein
MCCPFLNDWMIFDLIPKNPEKDRKGSNIGTWLWYFHSR